MSGSFANFVMLPIRAVEDAQLTDAQFRALAAVAAHQDKRTRWASPGHAEFAASLGRTTTQGTKARVALLLNACEALGYLEVRRQPRGSRNPNRYRVVLDLLGAASSSPSSSPIPELDEPDELALARARSRAPQARPSPSSSSSVSEATELALGRAQEPDTRLRKRKREREEATTHSDVSRSLSQEGKQAQEVAAQVPLPRDWQPSEAQRAFAAQRAAQKGWEADLGDVADLFIAHHRRARTLTWDWEAEWTTWVLRQRASAPAPATAEVKKTEPTPPQDLVEQLQAEKAAQPCLYSLDVTWGAWLLHWQGVEGLATREQLDFLFNLYYLGFTLEDAAQELRDVRKANEGRLPSIEKTLYYLRQFVPQYQPRPRPQPKEVVA